MMYVKSRTMTTMDEKQACEILGIPLDKSNSDNIKIQYKRLALKHHPDKNPGKGAERFIRVKEAYEFLKSFADKERADKALADKARAAGNLSFKDGITDSNGQWFAPGTKGYDVAKNKAVMCAKLRVYLLECCNSTNLSTEKMITTMLNNPPMFRLKVYHICLLKNIVRFSRKHRCSIHKTLDHMTKKHNNTPTGAK